MVEFNLEAERSFYDSLSDLGLGTIDDVIDELKRIESSKVDWDRFVANHGWVEVELTGQDTYPGADPLHWFAIVGKSGVEYQIAAKGPYGALVVCAVVVLRR